MRAYKNTTSAVYRFLFVFLLATSFISLAHPLRGIQIPLPPSGSSDNSDVYTPPGDAIVHMFNYPFKLIEQELPYLAETGFKYIQISPPQLSRGDIEWYGRYQPLDYRVIDGPLGTEEELRNLINEASKLQMGIIVDVVLNHMADLGTEYSLTYPPLWVQEKYGVGEILTANHFHPAFCIKNYENPEEVRKGRLCKPGKDSGGLPDLDLDQNYVLGLHKSYIQKLVDMGAAGFRFDAAKHMELEYFQRLLDSGLANGKFLFAEIIADRNSYDRDLGPYLKYTNLKLMDFPLQKTMKDAFDWGGDIRWLLAGEDHRAAIPGERSVSFVINHDIPNNDGFNYLILDPVDEVLAHIFMFARNGGVPHVYTDLGIRDRLKSNRWFMYHRKPVVRAGVKFHNLTRTASEKIVYADRCALVLQRGVEGIATLNKCSHEIHVKLNAPLEMDYIDLLSDQYLTREFSRLMIKIPPRGGQLFVRAR